MQIRSLPAEEPAVRRYVEALWLPYHRELETIVEGHTLADGVDIVAEEVAYRLDRLRTTSHRVCVAVEGEAGTADLGDGDLAGFITTEIRESPTVFEHPDRLGVGDIYVREPFRGTGLADDLIDRAANRGRESGCSELVLDVDVDNERAIAFYEKRGFEPYRSQMSIDLSEQ